MSVAGADRNNCFHSSDLEVYRLDAPAAPPMVVAGVPVEDPALPTQPPPSTPPPVGTGTARPGAAGAPVAPVVSTAPAGAPTVSPPPPPASASGTLGAELGQLKTLTHVKDPTRPYRLFIEVGRDVSASPIQAQDPAAASKAGETVISPGLRLYPWSTPYGQDGDVPPAAVMGLESGLVTLRLGVQFNQAAKVGLHWAVFADLPLSFLFGAETYTLSRGNQQAILNALQYQNGTVAIDADGDCVADDVDGDGYPDSVAVNYQDAYRSYLEGSSITFTRGLGSLVKGRLGANLGPLTPFIGVGLPYTRTITGTNLRVSRDYNIDPVSPVTYNADGSLNLDNAVNPSVQLTATQTVFPLSLGTNVNLGAHLYVGTEVSMEILMGNAKNQSLSGTASTGAIPIDVTEVTRWRLNLGCRF